MYLPQDDFRRDYESYMQSPEWANLRNIRIEIDRGRCCMCGQELDLKLQTHHFRYNKNGVSILGHENPWTDIASLCPKCHRDIHSVMNRVTGRRADGSLMYGWADQLPLHIRKILIERGLM